MSIANGTTAFSTPPRELAPFPVRRFTVDEYQQLGAAGVLREHDRVELLQGWIVEKMIHNPPHDGTIGLAEDSLRPVLPADWRLRIQSAITLAESEPEPDIAVVKGPARQYLNRHPHAEDVALLVEVAETSLDRDRYKSEIYGMANIPVYWIVNLIDRRIEVYSDPTGHVAAPTYRRRQDFGPNDELPLIIEGKEIATIPVAEILP